MSTEDITNIKIVSGAGGLESVSTMTIIANMYTEFFLKEGVKFTFAQNGNEILISAKDLPEDIKEILTKECGIHRVVRISPHDIQKRRHTSFTRVSTNDVPVVDWGFESHVRSYVFNPYEAIRSHKTDVYYSAEDMKKIVAGDLRLLATNGKKLEDLA